MSWKELIQSLVEDAEFFPPTTLEQLHQAEEAVRAELPDELKSLLMETDGAFGMYLGLIWPTQQIAEDNLALRVDYKPIYPNEGLDTLLCFAEAGNGDLFAYKITDGRVVTTDIYAWNHEDDSRVVIASSLKDYLQGWLQGTITI